MRGFLDKGQLEIKSSFFIYLAFLLLFVPIKWIISWIIAAIIHELFHYIAVLIFRHRVYKITINMLGVIMQTEPLPSSHELICALSGPVGGILLIIFVRWIPFVALCACIQSIYNLIPIYPLDGGRAVKCILTLIFSEHVAERIISWIEKILLCIILVLTLHSVFHYNLGFIPILVITSVILKLRMIKIPCKRGQLEVQ